MTPATHGGAIRRRIDGHPGRLALVVGGVALMGLLILLPLAAVFIRAFRDGWSAYIGYLSEPTTLHSIKLTLLASAIAVPVNTVFGLVAAWAVAMFDFPGKKWLISLIELPLSISPIVIGVAYLFVFGVHGLFGRWLLEHDIRLVFSVTAIVLVTTIVTAPYVFREVLPLLQSRGRDEELAAASLGAGGWQIFTRVTLPAMKWALVYGVSLCFARSLGEFGSVAIVSGAVRGETNTMSLQIDLLFQDRVQTAAFALASLLTLIALLTLGVKAWVEAREKSLLVEIEDEAGDSDETRTPWNR